MKKIKIITENQCLHGELNDTLTARELGKRLPLTFVCKKNGPEYSTATACEVFEPSELQIGWKNGDILLWNGWFVIDVGGEAYSAVYGPSMVVGHTDEYLQLVHEKTMLRLTLVEDDGSGTGTFPSF